MHHRDSGNRRRCVDSPPRSCTQIERSRVVTIGTVVSDAQRLGRQDDCGGNRRECLGLCTTCDSSADWKQREGLQRLRQCIVYQRAQFGPGALCDDNSLTSNVGKQCAQVDVGIGRYGII